MKRLVILFTLVMLAFSGLFIEISAQHIPERYNWVYGHWLNPKTGDEFLLSPEGLRETHTRRLVGLCYLGVYPTLDVRKEALKLVYYFDNHIGYEGQFGYEQFLGIGDNVLYDGSLEYGDKMVRITDPLPQSETNQYKNPAIGKWVNALGNDYRLEITQDTFKTISPLGSYYIDYSLSEEGYIITDDDVYIISDYGATLYHYSHTHENRLITTYVRDFSDNQ